MIDEIEKIVIEGFDSLSYSIYNYWPLPDDDDRNEISEANLTLHVASSFISSQFFGKSYVFSDYRINENEHLDFKVVPPNCRVEIIGECKRYLATDETSLSRDIERMLDIKPGKGNRLFGVVLTMTQKENIADWWTSSNRSEYPSTKHRAEEWLKLRNILDKIEARCGIVSIGYDNQNGFFHKGLYGLFEISHNCSK